MSKVFIGMGTCGLATGAGQVKTAVEKWAAARSMNVRITPTGCIGYCKAEPIMDVVTESGHRISYSNVTPDVAGFILDEVFVRKNYKLDGLLGQFKNGKAALPGIPMINEHPYFRKQVKYVLRNCGVIDPESITDYKSSGGFQGFERSLSMSPAEVIQEITRSGLRGRGGSGFLTGKKWELALREKNQKKYVICNADEGDPGAFMDRSILEGDVYSVLEGMMTAGYAIGADEGIIYCRAEYPLAIERILKAIEVLKKEGLLEKPIGANGFQFKLRVKKGAGAFVCGEETALMASVEGRRGMPRPRPPFPSVAGLFQKPTIVNNVETMANVSHIMREGAESFASMGTATSKGTKVFALTGKVVNTGLVEVPMGITLREIVFDIGGGIPDGKEFKAVQIGGPSGGCIPVQHLDTQIDYESLKTLGTIMGSGGLVVMDQDTCMVDMARYFLSFITSESCGKCIPCREGTQRLYEVLDSIVSPYSKMRKEEENLLRFNRVLNMESLAQVIKDTSLCGLGQSAPNPVLSTLRFFKTEYDAHIYERKCPAHQCKGLLTFTIDTNACTGCTLCAKKCPTGAIVGEKKKAHYIVDEKCIRCGTCRDVCRFDSVFVS
ncbi:MAG TPA: NADH-ubiquinone oxidoreductase-F iron-sulfur binding region domain-containing protein [Spirochaetia bacterium]|nr:NADH-ubiquinone oxidoreductase-F iron-sulfur binding region domain-containing protein [Spirochaetia bacterium]